MRCPNGCGETITDRKVILIPKPPNALDDNVGLVRHQYVYPYVCSKCDETFKKDELLP